MWIASSKHGKILKILHIITGLNPGGAENVLLRLILATPQHEHTVMCLTNGGVVGEKLKSKGIAVHELSFSFFNLLKNIVFIKKLYVDS